MSGWNKWGIRRKLFSIILLILAINVIVLVFMGSTLFEVFYQANKVTELKKSAKRISAAYEQNSAAFYDEIGKIENENALVSVFSEGEDGQMLVTYHSRMWKNEQEPDPRVPPAPADKQANWQAEMFDRLQEELKEAAQNANEGLSVQKGSSKDHGKMEDSITISARLDENLYLFIQTPRGYIKSTADLAVKYTALLSIVILLGGAVLIYFVVGRITKPIQKIEEAANQISRMDFSRKCEVTGGDELSKLAVSINNMSGELEASIDKLVQANEVLQNDLVRQQQTDRMRQQFVANVSHDFKTPLTLIISYAEALSARELAGEGRECCDIIISEGNKLSRMVGKLLSLSKLESGIDRAEKSNFCLNEVLDAEIKSQRILIEKQCVTVEKHLDDAFIVCADYQKIVQVATNLFENAVKYTPVGGRITVSSEALGEVCRVSVENTGTQIQDDDLENVFESFYRADKARAAGQSYGLGLAIVKVVMEAHHQAYGVENTPEGVRFWFELELAEIDDLNDEE